MPKTRTAPAALDPYQLDPLIEKCEALLLHRLLAYLEDEDEGIAFKDCYTALGNVQRVAYVRASLREKDQGSDRVGSTVRKYETSFAPSGGSGSGELRTGAGSAEGADNPFDDNGESAA